MTEFNAAAWFDEEIKPDQITLTKFDECLKEYITKRRTVDDLEEIITAHNKELMKMSSRLIEYFELMGKDKHILPEGMGSITRVETKKWKAPEGELRLPLVEFLKEKDEYDNVMAFNANKFHSWYQASCEADPEFNSKFAGVSQTSTKYLKYTKGK